MGRTVVSGRNTVCSRVQCRLLSGYLVAFVELPGYHAPVARYAFVDTPPLLVGC